MRQQVCKRPLWADVIRFAPFQLFFRRNVLGNRQKAIETTRIVAAIFVLCAAVHGSMREHAAIVGADWLHAS